MTGQRNDCLDRPLAERPGAENYRAAMILQRTRDDLRCGRRAAIDQDDDRQALGNIARFGVEALAFVRPTRSGRNDLALVQKRIGNPHRLVQQTAGIVPQVQNDAFQLAGGFLLKAINRPFHAGRSLFAEGSDPDIGDVVAFHPRPDRPNLDNVPRDGDVEWFAPFPPYRELQIATHLATHLLDGL